MGTSSGHPKPPLSKVVDISSQVDWPLIYVGASFLESLDLKPLAVDFSFLHFFVNDALGVDLMLIRTMYLSGLPLK